MSFVITQTSQGGTNIQFNVLWSVSGVNYIVQTDSSLEQTLWTMFTIADYLAANSTPDYRLLRPFPKTDNGSDANYNTAVGVSALDAYVTGIENTAVGYLALAQATAPVSNTAVGSQAMFSNLTGIKNVAIGSTAMYKGTAPQNCIAIGEGSLRENLTGSSNIAIGTDALRNSLSSLNTAVGNNALGANISGSGTAVGAGALSAQNNGGGNTAVGLNAGNSIVSGSSNTLLGQLANVDSGARNFCVVLGASTTSPAVNGSLSIGGTGGNAMTNLNVATSGAVAAGEFLNIYINGVQRKIALLLP